MVDLIETKRMNRTDQSTLRDTFGRRFEYLRLSLTDRCNFRCTYCLPNGFRKVPGLAEELSRDELRRAVTAFAGLGMWKLRLTGGEPTVRPDFDAILRDLKEVEGIEKIALTTNGYRLEDRAAGWRADGLDAINVSIDTLDRASFARTTGHDRLLSIIKGVEVAIDAGFPEVKINSVLLKSLGSEQWDDILAFVKNRPVSWRFIELMRTNDNVGFHEDEATPGAAVMARLRASGWKPVARKSGSGPAVEYAHPSYVGRIGLIAPYSPGF